MLYTLSQSHYDLAQLTTLLANFSEQDCLLCWQNGVLLPIKYPSLFQTIPHYYLLENDVIARGLEARFLAKDRNVSLINLAELIALSEKFYPQISL